MNILFVLYEIYMIIYQRWTYCKYVFIELVFFGFVDGVKQIKRREEEGVKEEEGEEEGGVKEEGGEEEGGVKEEGGEGGGEVQKAVVPAGFTVLGGFEKKAVQKVLLGGCSCTFCYRLCSGGEG